MTTTTVVKAETSSFEVSSSFVFNSKVIRLSSRRARRRHGEEYPRIRRRLEYNNKDDTKSFEVCSTYISFVFNCRKKKEGDLFGAFKQNIGSQKRETPFQKPDYASLRAFFVEFFSSFTATAIR